MKTSEALAQGAEYIAENGWCQNQLRDGDKVCAMGAIHAVTLRWSKTQPDHWTVVGQDPCSRAREALVNRLGVSVPWWNDDPRTTQEDVILTMKTVAYELAERGE